MRPGDLVAYVDRDGLIHDATVISVINDGNAPYNALTIKTLDDGVERSRVQYDTDRPANLDTRVLSEHISAGHWRPVTDDERRLFQSYADRRAKTAQALAEVDETPKKDEEPADTAKRVAEAKTKITSAKGAQEPPPLVDEAPRPGEAPETTKKRIAASKEVLKGRQ
jgi:hypothetical protein